MKNLPLHNTSYRYLEQHFTEWLEVLGYAESTIKKGPVHVRELLYHLEQINIVHITALTPSHIRSHLNQLKKRSNQRHGGGLSSSSINSHITSINLFTRYLMSSGLHPIDYTPRRVNPEVEERQILTRKEVQQLYDASYYHHRQGGSAFGQRDRAILSLLYGCGLRKSEAIGLDIGDIDFTKRVVLVRKGKGGKSRYVPIFGRVVEDLDRYLQDGRYWFLEDGSSVARKKQGQLKEGGDRKAYLLGIRGKRLRTFEFILDHLKERSGISTSFSAHSLRHSIATHLLESGMSIEEISKFLGHSSLESTQIYTHVTASRAKPLPLSHY